MPDMNDVPSRCRAALVDPSPAMAAHRGKMIGTVAVETGLGMPAGIAGLAGATAQAAQAAGTVDGLSRELGVGQARSGAHGSASSQAAVKASPGAVPAASRARARA